MLLRCAIDQLIGDECIRQGASAFVGCQCKRHSWVERIQCRGHALEDRGHPALLTEKWKVESGIILPPCLSRVRLVTQPSDVYLAPCQLIALARLRHLSTRATWLQYRYGASLSRWHAAQKLQRYSPKILDRDR